MDHKLLGEGCKNAERDVLMEVDKSGVWDRAELHLLFMSRQNAAALVILGLKMAKRVDQDDYTYM